MQNEAKNNHILEIPGEAVSSESILLLWKKAQEGKKDITYQIYRDNRLVAETTETSYLVKDLQADTGYEFVIKIDGMQYSNVVSMATEKERVRISVRETGAVGDGLTDDTEAIQKAIDSCPVNGCVVVPAGTYVSGALFLKSNMEFCVERGGCLLGSTKLEMYPVRRYRFEGIETDCYSSLLNICTEPAELEKAKACRMGKVEHVRITGHGVIDASGSQLRQKELAQGKGKPGRAICFACTDGVYFQDITVRQCPAWCVHMIYCRHVTFYGIGIYTKYDERGKKYPGIVNGDGLDIDSCSHVQVLHSLIASEDDCIAIKSGRDLQGREIGIPSEDILVSDCRFESGFGVVVGSEMSGGVRNVLVQDCICRNVYSAVSIKVPRGRGGVIEDICYENIDHEYTQELTDCKWFRGAIYLDMYYGEENPDLDREEEVTEATPVIRNISIRNVRTKTSGGYAVYMAGLPESRLYGITMENVQAVGEKNCRIVHTELVNVENVTIDTDMKQVENVTSATGLRQVQDVHDQHRLKGKEEDDG